MGKGVEIQVIKQNGKKLVDARDLHKVLGVKQRFKDWIRVRINAYGYKEGDDYLFFIGRHSDSRITDYLIDLDMAKELAIIEKGKGSRQLCKRLSA